MGDEPLPFAHVAQSAQEYVATPSASADTGSIRVGPQTVAEAYEVPGVIVGTPQWHRITKRLKDIKHDWSAIFLGASFTAFGIAGACAIALVTVPEEKPARAQRAAVAGISSGTRVGAVVILIASFVVFVGFLIAYFIMHSGIKDLCADIRDEMLANASRPPTTQ